MLKKNLFCCICLGLFTLAVSAQEPDFKIVESRSGKTLSLEQLLDRLKDARVMIWGEEHNDSTGHRLEAALFSQLVSRYPGTALSLEMFSTDVQPVINEYLLGIISEKNLIKEARAWNNYADYRPMVELARLHHADVIAANAAARYTNAVSLGGLQRLNSLPESSRAFLPPLPVDTATGRYYEKFTETMGGHEMGGMKIFQAQNLWDATMAWSIAQYTQRHPERKVLHLNGRFHSDEYAGVVAQLHRYAPGLVPVTLSCFSAADFRSADLQQYRKLADYIILTRP